MRYLNKLRWKWLTLLLINVKLKKLQEISKSAGYLVDEMIVELAYKKSTAIDAMTNRAVAIMCFDSGRYVREERILALLTVRLLVRNLW